MNFHNHCPLIFGEVLFDHFPDKRHVLGGAPFNVAWHLRGLKQQPLLVSAIGEDEPAGQIKKAMQDWQLASDFVYGVADKATGRVEITLHDGQPQFSILDDQAYDAIPYPHGIEDKPVVLIYHGSLALRHEHNRTLLSQLVKQTNADTFLDVNLRDPWWDKDLLHDWLRQARWVKVNDDELINLCQTYALGGDTLEQQALAFKHHFAIDELIVTRGAKGACAWWDDDKHCCIEPEGEITVADTVGAGDSFSAMLIHGILNRWDMKTTLTRAQQLAARVCQITGATTLDKTLYDQLL